MDITSINEFLQPLADQNLVSGTILIAKNGQVEVKKAYGYSDREKGIKNEISTRFRLSSTTKIFTAVSILQLYENKKLDLEDQLGKYIPNNWPEITIFQLLTHSSGIPTYSWTIANGQKQDLEFMVSYVLGLDLRFEPGSSVEYSNSGYALLTRVIELVSGLSYMDYLSENIFKPLNMENSGLYDMDEKYENFASGYSLKEDGQWEIQSRISPLGRGDGDLYSTIGDLYHFGTALLENTLISKETWDIQTTPFLEKHGLGCFVDQMNGLKTVYHQGGTLGYMSNLRLFPDENTLVISLFNSDNLIMYRIEEKIARWALDKTISPIFLDNSSSLIAGFTDYQGSYHVDEETTIEISIENDCIFYEEKGYPIYSARILDQETIYVVENNSRIHFYEEKGKKMLRGFLGLFLVIGEKMEAKHIAP